jgi:hypothetical protein
LQIFKPARGPGSFDDLLEQLAKATPEWFIIKTTVRKQKFI